MRPSQCLILTSVATLCVAALSGPAAAAGRVQLELVADDRTPVTGRQQWLRGLAQVGVTNLRIRARGPSDEPRIEVLGSETAPVYVVTGLITSSNEVIVPGARFRLSQAARLAAWLEELGRLGPPEKRPKRSAFGLTAAELGQVHDDLAQPLGFSTQGVPRAEAVRQILRRLRLPLRGSVGAISAAGDEKVAEELSSLTLGTALAYLLRPGGLCLVPRASAQGDPEHAIVRAAPEIKAWPVGWEPGRTAPIVLPAMYDSLNVNIEGVTVTTVLGAVGGRLKVPILPDHKALARHGVDPGKIFVSLPRKRMTYIRVLRMVLSKAGLKSELRVDEADTPFLWVTTVKPI